MDTTTVPFVDTVSQRLNALLAQLCHIGNHCIAPDMPIFGEGLNLDSVNSINLVIEVEAEFGILFDDCELNIETFRTVGILTKCIRRKLGLMTHRN